MNSAVMRAHSGDPGCFSQGAKTVASADKTAIGRFPKTRSSPSGSFCNAAPRITPDSVELIRPLSPDAVNPVSSYVSSGG